MSLMKHVYYTRADPRFAASQWETVLQSNTVSHWLGANLESALLYHAQDGIIWKTTQLCWNLLIYTHDILQVTCVWWCLQTEETQWRKLVWYTPLVLISPHDYSGYGVTKCGSKLERPCRSCTCLCTILALFSEIWVKLILASCTIGCHCPYLFVVFVWILQKVQYLDCIYLVSLFQDSFISQYMIC